MRIISATRRRGGVYVGNTVPKTTTSFPVQFNQIAHLSPLISAFANRLTNARLPPKQNNQQQSSTELPGPSNAAPATIKRGRGRPKNPVPAKSKPALQKISKAKVAKPKSPSKPRAEQPSKTTANAAGQGQSDLQMNGNGHAFASLSLMDMVSFD